MAGSEFLGRESAGLREARARHSVTRMRAMETVPERARLGAARTGRVAFLIYGVLLGILLWAALHPVKG